MKWKLFLKGIAAAAGAAALHAGIDAATSGGAALLPSWAQPILTGALFVAAWFKSQPTELQKPK